MSNAEEELARLDALLHEQWEYTLRTNPEFASILGDKRWNGELSDFSQEHIDDDLREARRFRAAFSRIDPAGLPEQAALNLRLMLQQLDERIEDYDYREWEMPVSQISGIHIDAPQLVSVLDFSSASDYADWTRRLRALPRLFRQTAEQMRRGVEHGLVPPRFLLGRVAEQTESFASGSAEESAFAEPLSRFPEGIGAAEQAELRRAMLAAIDEAVLPAYREFAAFLRSDYLPHGREEAGVWSLPDGEARYALRVRRSTTTSLTPDQIHAIGLEEVAAIEAEMLTIARKLGHESIAALNEAIEADTSLRAGTREFILEAYRRHIGDMEQKLPLLFGRLPRAGMKVMPIEAYREEGAPGAQYMQGTPDGSRPGQILVNTAHPEHRKLLTFEATAYHEGVPGHHLQISIAQELPALPPFRQQANYTAYIEGWALYSERLGKEVGFYTNPYSDYGRLQDEMLRAIRLVVDTGLHARRWTRQQVVDFFHDHSAIDEVEVQNETDRYIVWPAQALAYKTGQRKFLELRARAQKALGDAFDIRRFHDHVLEAGALPLDILDERLDGWLATQR